MQVVRVDVREAALELVAEPRVRVLADRHEEVGAQVRALHAAGEVVGEALALGRALVVLEELLELVEDHEQRAVARAGPALERLLETVAAGAERARQLDVGVAAPAAEDERDEPRAGRGGEPRHDAGAQQRALADAAARVQQREPRRLQVGDDPLALGVAPEEPVGVRLAERRQPDVRSARRSPAQELLEVGQVVGRRRRRSARPRASARSRRRARRRPPAPPTTSRRARPRARRGAGRPAGSTRARRSPRNRKWLSRSFVQQLRGDEVLDRALAQEADVVVLGDDEPGRHLQAGRRVVHGAAVDLEDDRCATGRRSRRSGTRRTRSGRAIGSIARSSASYHGMCRKRPRSLAGGDADRQVERLAGALERALERRVVGRRDQERIALAVRRAQQRREARERVVDRARARPDSLSSSSRSARSSGLGPSAARTCCATSARSVESDSQPEALGQRARRARPRSGSRPQPGAHVPPRRPSMTPAPSTGTSMPRDSAFATLR